MVQVSQLSATEGSCADIKCSSEARLSSDNAKWFWMKDSVWNQIISDYVNITYVYSSNHPDVNSDFSGRVEYIGTEPPWREGQACSIRICDLRMTDSGRYRFRFVGEAKYSTEDTTLTVTSEYGHKVCVSGFKDNNDGYGYTQMWMVVCFIQLHSNKILSF